MTASTLAWLVLNVIGLAAGVWAASLVVRGIKYGIDAAKWRASALRRKAGTAPAPPATARSRRWRHVIPTVGGVVLLLLTSLIFVYADWWRGGGIGRFDVHNFDVSSLVLINSLLLAGACVIVGWHFDTARGRRRCPTCWYSLEQTMGRLCPECGHEAGDERSLRRTRRSRGLMVGALVPLILGTGIIGFSRYRTGGAVALMPTPVLIAFFERFPEEWITGTQISSSAPGNLSVTGIGVPGWRFLSNRDLSPWERRWLERRCDHALATSDDIATVYRAATLQYDRDAELPRAAWQNAVNVAVPLLTSGDTRTRGRATIVLQLVLERAPLAGAPNPELVAMIRSHSDGLVAALADPVPIMFIESVRLLTLDPDASEALVDRVLAATQRRPSEQEQRYGARFIGGWATRCDAAFRRLSALARSEIEGERAYAAAALGGCATPNAEVATVLASLLHDASDRVAHEAAGSARIAATVARESKPYAILTGAAAEEFRLHPARRRAMAGALSEAKYDGDDIIPAIVALSSDADFLTAMSAIDLIVNRGRRAEGVLVLLRVARDGPPPAEREARVRLGQVIGMVEERLRGGATDSPDEPK